MVEHPQKSPERLAEAGFAAVAMDVYGEGKLTTDAARQWMDEPNACWPRHVDGRCKLIMDDFTDLEAVDTNRLGAIGFCFGGKIALDMARGRLPTKAVATFHGNPTPKQPAQKVSSLPKYWWHMGEADSMVSMDAIEGLKRVG